ncbi:MAG: site-2 protease family protein [Erysipelotrichales bacterium]|nr:site-2 protease family protein [Erysipelotrichales bacterium]
MGIIYFVILLGSIVLVHEFGHFVFAKLFNVYTPEFSIGMGPQIFQFQKGETKYTLRLLPMGGYVAMAGEDGVDEDIELDPSRTIKGIHPFKQLIIMMAGIFMNVLFAYVIFFGIFAYNGQVYLPPEPVFDQVLEGSVAEEMGVQPGDEIIKLVFSDGSVVEPETYYDFVNHYTFYQDEEVTFTLLRGNEVFEVTMAPRYLESEGRNLFGIVAPSSTPVDLSLMDCFYYAGVELQSSASSIFMTLSKLVRGRGLDMMSGPVGIYEVTQTQVSYGLTSYLALIGMISVNVGIFNALPLPILDGGRSLITLCEWGFKKKLNPKIEHAIMMVAWGMILALFIFVTYNDLIRVFS